MKRASILAADVGIPILISTSAVFGALSNIRLCTDNAESIKIAMILARMDNAIVINSALYKLYASLLYLQITQTSWTFWAFLKNLYLQPYQIYFIFGNPRGDFHKFLEFSIVSSILLFRINRVILRSIVLLSHNKFNCKY